MSERQRFHSLAIPNKNLVIVTKGTPRLADCLLPGQRVAALEQFENKYSHLFVRKLRREEKNMTKITQELTIRNLRKIQ